MLCSNLTWMFVQPSLGSIRIEPSTNGANRPRNGTIALPLRDIVHLFYHRKDMPIIVDLCRDHDHRANIPCLSPTGPYRVRRRRPGIDLALRASRVSNRRRYLNGSAVPGVAPISNSSRKAKRVVFVHGSLGPAVLSGAPTLPRANWSTTTTRYRVVRQLGIDIVGTGLYRRGSIHHWTRGRRPPAPPIPRAT